MFSALLNFLNEKNFELITEHSLANAATSKKFLERRFLAEVHYFKFLTIQRLEIVSKKILRYLQKFFLKPLNFLWGKYPLISPSCRFSSSINSLLIVCSSWKGSFNPSAAVRPIIVKIAAFIVGHKCNYGSEIFLQFLIVCTKLICTQKANCQEHRFKIVKNIDLKLFLVLRGPIVNFSNLYFLLTIRFDRRPLHDN